MGISWYDLSKNNAEPDIVPGDCHATAPAGVDRALPPRCGGSWRGVVCGPACNDSGSRELTASIQQFAKFKFAEYTKTGRSK